MNRKMNYNKINTSNKLINEKRKVNKMKKKLT